MANEIDTFEGTVKSKVVSSAIIGGATGITSSSTWSQICTAMENSGGNMQSLVGGGSASNVPSNATMSREVSARDSNHDMHTDTGTWSVEFPIYKTINGKTAVLNYIHTDILGLYHKAYEGRIYRRQASYIIKTNTGRVLQSGVCAFDEWDSAYTLTDNSYATTPIICSTLGTGDSNATKIILEVSYDLQCYTNPGHGDSAAWIRLRAINTDANYIYK